MSSESPSLIGRMDKLLSGLITEAEHATSGAGDDSGQRASLAERIALLKAGTDYLKVRDTLQDAKREPEAPEIDGLITRLRTNDNRTLGRRARS